MPAALAEPLTTGAMVPWPHRVLTRRRETADTWTLALEPLEPLDSGRLAIEPGQFAMVYAFGVGEVPISTSGDTAAAPLVHTVRAVGPVTQAICAAQPGEVLGIRGPYGNTWPLEDAVGADVVIVAGGVGLAPLRPAVYHLLAHRAEYGKVVLLYGGRMPAELLFRRDLERWRSRFDFDVAVTVDSAGRDWRGHVGVVTTLIPRAAFDPASTVALVCGPEIMMRFAGKALADAGVPTESIYVSLERTMRCGIGLCGHCQLGPTLVCRDGPVYSLAEIGRFTEVREL